ncbi:hypothetical protein [Actinomadura bangladeshensis]|nr:hypothetical protein [Actinomadura bangladeshensis]
MSAASGLPVRVPDAGPPSRTGTTRRPASARRLGHATPILEVVLRILAAK